MVDYTDYQQRALYGAGQSASRAGQRFHMEREALERGDKKQAKYHRARANALNRQGAYAAVQGMGGDQGANQYFPVQSSGQPIRSSTTGNIALSSAGRDIFDRFRDTGFVEPIRQKRRYAPNTEPKGLSFLIDKIASNTLMGKILGSMRGEKTPEPDDAYYKSLWGKGLNEMYSPSGIFTSGDFLGEPELDPYYDDSIGADAPLDFVPGINEINPEGMDKVIPPYGISPLVPEHIKKSTLWGINKAVEEEEGIFGGVGRGDLADDFDYESDRENRELSAKIAFLESVNPHIDYDNVHPSLIDELYEKALKGEQGTAIEEEVIPEIITEEAGQSRKYPYHSKISMPGNI